MIIALLGDLHGDPTKAHRCLRRVCPDFALQAGDYYCYNFDWEFPVYWISGNHENANRIDFLRGQKYCSWRHSRTNRFLPAGLTEIEGVKIATLPGLPQDRIDGGPASFYAEDKELCLSISEPVDIFLSHGNAFPLISSSGGVIKNMEEADVTEVAQHLKPKYAVSAHNHCYERIMHEGIDCIRLGYLGGDLHFLPEVDGTPVGGFEVIEV